MDESAQQGLTTAEAAKRLAAFGPNAVAEPRTSLAAAIARRLWEPVPWMLEAAIVLQLAIGERLEASIIAVLLLLNVMLGLFQESRAGGALAALKKNLALNASVKRDGRWMQVPTAALVPGDTVRLALGGLVPADVRILEGSVLLDQSMLTGESVAVEAGAGKTAYASALVRRGAATATVTATGARSYFGKTAELVRIAHAASAEQAAVLGVVRNLAIFNGAVVVLLVAYAHSISMPVERIVPLVLTALLASVPVALPATFTLAAALSAQALGKKGVLLTRLSAIHEAAAVDVLCSDKTGTLTRNELSIAAIKPVRGSVREEQVIAAAALASSETDQDPVDSAVRAAAKDRGAPDPARRVLRFTPFDPATKIAEAVVLDASGAQERILKGAPAAVAKVAPFSADMDDALKALTAQGYRVLAVAGGHGLQPALLGLIALGDPPRADSRELLDRLRALGVRTLMVTGDAAATAASVAAAIGLEGAVCPPGGMPERVEPDDFGVYAGVFPEDKFRLVKALQAAGHTVAMCGDGANDAPALRQAQMGIAVSSATDVAKSAASMVLVTPGLEGIVAAVREGRRAFQRILTYTLNAIIKKVELVLFLGAGLVLTGHAILTPMLMALLLITGDFLTMSLASDRATPSAQPEVWRMRSIAWAGAVLGAIGLVYLVGVVAVAKYVRGYGVEQLRTLAFLALVLVGQATVYVVRERGHFWRSRPGGWIVLSSLADIGIAGTLAGTGTLMQRLPPSSMAALLLATLAFSLVLDTAKVATFRRLRM